MSDPDAAQQVLEQVSIAGVLDGIQDLFYVLDAEGSLLHWNDRLPGRTGYTDAEIAELRPVELFVERDRSRVAEAIGSVLEAGRTETVIAEMVVESGAHVPYELNGTPVRDDAGDVVGLAGIGRDVTERRERERTLTAQRNELARLHNLNAVIRDILSLLVHAEERETIEAAVCDRLADEDAYRLAWIGTVNPGTEAITPRRSAGDAEGFVDEIDPSTTGGGGGPAARAVAREEVVVETVPDEPTDDPWAKAASRRGFRSAVSVPIVYDGVQYGVLNVYATLPGAFERRERRVLRELCDAVGYALNAVARREALAGDALVELTYDVDPTTSGFERVVESGASLRFERLLSTEDDVYLWYVLVENGGETTGRRLDDVSWIDGVERLGERDGDPRFQLSVSASAAPRGFAEHGVRLRSLSATGDRLTVTVEAPRASVRVATAVVREAFQSSDLVSKRSVEGRPPVPADLPGAIANALTERQRLVLEAAYYGGYFDRSRAVTGGELAESIGISRPTFHEHLRVAQRKLLDVAFATGE
ncbi:MAG: helix-turn-helix domain-containing protein [Salinigranum sp.]